MSYVPALLVKVAPDLDTVTTVGYEDDPADVGLSKWAVESLWDPVRAWYRLGTTPAIQMCLRRNGKVVLNRAIGHGWGNGPDDKPGAPRVLLTPDTPICGFSTAKGVAATVMAMLIEQGAFKYDDPVSRYVPEFALNGKAEITIGDVMSHSAGVPFVTPPYRGTDLVFDEDLALQGLADLIPSWRPGRLRVYHALTSGLILRLVVQRATGKRLREHLAQQVLQPLGFRWTNFGVAESEVDQVVPSVKVGPGPSRTWAFLSSKALGGRMDKVAAKPKALQEFLTAELPSGNLVTTAEELSRFYEILARGGELDGVRIMQPQTLLDAVAPAPRIPSLAGRVSRAGFELGGRSSKFGRNTEEHFGRSGLTTQYGWADPARGLSGAILTSGKSALDQKRPWQVIARIADVLTPLSPTDRIF